MDTQETLALYRKQIDSIDEELACLIAQRMALSDSIGNYKRAHDIPVCSESREEQVIKHAVSRSGLTYADSVRRVYGSILEESRARQNRK